MPTAMTAHEQELVDALEMMLDLTVDMEPVFGSVPGAWGEWAGVRMLAEIAIAHVQREPHCCWGNCDLDTCYAEQPARPGQEVGE